MMAAWGQVLLNYGYMLGSEGLCWFTDCHRLPQLVASTAEMHSLAFWRQALRVGGLRPLSVALGDNPSLRLPASGGC